MRVEIKPEMVRWARERSGKSVPDLIKSFPKIDLWESGEVNPTFKQLENFAKKTHLPIGSPLIFINGSDTKSAQMFTIAHELAHLWLGESALSDIGPASLPSNEIENWCNKVAAELLVPYSVIADEFQEESNIFDEMNRLARFFKVSTLVILRRIYDIRAISEDKFGEMYDLELKRLLSIQTSRGGDFYKSQPARLSKRFARAVVSSTLEGQSSFTESFRLLGIKKMSTFRDLGASLGVSI